MQVLSNRLQHFLKLHQVPYSTIEHAQAFTSQETAATMHVPGKTMAKVVVLQGRSSPYLGVLSASYQVDLDLFEKAVGEPVRLATEDRIRELFPDCEPGAVPPFGRLYDVQTYVDEALAEEAEIVFPAGSHSNAVRMSYRDFQELTMPEVRSFAAKRGSERRRIH
ncbi:MAG TPA: YbaK/EbsC family protein [Candidatus Dormibacteraeota bacterium]|nr:YbaK/EbsC family protein [Candidatus Dormibacteraeota bacterium]